MKHINAFLPGQDLVDQGLADLARGQLSESALLVLTAGSRLRPLGVPVPERVLSEPCEHLLYARLEERLGTDAHSHYNSLIRRITSFARALEAEVNRSRR